MAASTPISKKRIYSPRYQIGSKCFQIKSYLPIMLRTIFASTQIFIFLWDFNGFSKYKSGEGETIEK